MTILSGGRRHVPSQTHTVKHRLAAVAFGILVVLVYSTGAEMRGEALDWSTSARTALAAGIAWLLLVPVVIAADRQLPLARDVLYPRLLLHVPLSVVVSWAFAYVYYGASRALGVPVEAAVLTGSPVSAFHRFNWLVYWVVIGWYVASEYQDQARDRTVRTAELERLLTQSRLDTLRTQLHPHFLFNALNAISAHVESAPRTARWMLEQLGDLLRLALDHAEDQVIPLQRELAFVDRYMKLQKVRYEDRLDVVLDVDPLALQALVPTFILQPLLENAIRHGIATRSAPGQIEIQAWCEGDALHLSVRDDGPGLAVNWDIERQAGVGLSNTRERLKRLYGDRQSFAIAGAVGSGVQVDLRFPLQRAAEPREGANTRRPA